MSDLAADPREWTADQLMTLIAEALQARDFEAVPYLITLLAFKDPHLAETVHESMLTVLLVGRPTIKINNPQATRPWPYDGPHGRARLTGSLDTGGSFTDDDDYYRQSATACCPRETIPDSCSCLEGCECACLDCTCGEDDGDDFPEYKLP